MTWKAREQTVINNIISKFIIIITYKIQENNTPYTIGNFKLLWHLLCHDRENWDDKRSSWSKLVLLDWTVWKFPKGIEIHTTDTLVLLRIMLCYSRNQSNCVTLALNLLLLLLWNRFRLCFTVTGHNC